MMYVYKVLYHSVRIKTNCFFTMADNSRTRGHNFKIFNKHALRLTRRNSFSQRVINDWNSLPQHVVINDWNSLPRHVVLNDWNSLPQHVVINDWNNLPQHVVINDWNNLPQHVVINDWNSLPQHVIINDWDSLPQHVIINDWNSLPQHVVKAPSINTFKNKLDDWWSEEQLIIS